MNRRDLIKSSALGLMTLTAYSTLAQAEEPPPPACPPTKPDPAILVEISKNHRHDVVVNYEQVIVGDSIQLSIQGQSSHPHTLVLTEEILQALRKNKVIEVESSVDAGHSHIVRLSRQSLNQA